MVLSLALPFSAVAALFESPQEAKASRPAVASTGKKERFIRKLKVVEKERTLVIPSSFKAELITVQVIRVAQG